MPFRDDLRSAGDFISRVLQRTRNYAREDLSHSGMRSLQDSWLYILAAVAAIAALYAIAGIFYLIYSAFYLGFSGTLAALGSIPAWMGAKLGGLVGAINSVLPSTPHFVQLILGNFAALATAIKTELLVIAGKAAVTGTATLTAFTPALISAAWFLLAVVSLAGCFKLGHLAYQEREETRLANSHTLDVPPPRATAIDRSEFPTAEGYFQALALNSLIEKVYADFNNYNYTTRKQVVNFLNAIQLYRHHAARQPQLILEVSDELTKLVATIEGSRGTPYSTNYFLPGAGAAVAAAPVATAVPAAGPAAAGPFVGSGPPGPTRRAARPPPPTGGPGTEPPPSTPTSGPRI